MGQSFSIDAWSRLCHPSDVQLSPDGQFAAFVYGPNFKPDPNTPVQKDLYVVDVATGSQSVLTPDAHCTNLSPRWSPDSHQIAFISNRADQDETQLFVMDRDGTHVRQLTDLRGSAHTPIWMPDGNAILFLYDGTLDPHKQPAPDPVVWETNPRFNRVWRCDLATGALEALTPATTHCFEYALSPDGSALVMFAAPHPNPLEGWYAAQLYRVELATQAVSQVCTLAHQAGRFTWSPDGTQIGFVAGIMSDEGNISGEVFTVLASGGEPRCLTPGLDHSVTWIEWRAEGIVYGGRHIDCAVVGKIDPVSGAVTRIASGEYSINGTRAQQIGTCNGSQFTALCASFTEPPTIYLGSLDGGDWQPLLSWPNDDAVFPPLRVESRSWAGPDDMPVQGFLIYPPDYMPGQRYPLFVNVHGGPSWCYVPEYYLSWPRLLAARGCLVLLPNPRGSWGRGLAYQEANVGDLGGGDWLDIYAGIDPLIDAGLADPDRLAVGGWSYGGYLTTWAVTQTDRFRCAVAGAGITNYVSNYGVDGNREWQSTMFGSNVYDDMDFHRTRSPISYVNRVKTPTLLVHGEKDQLAPPGQAIEFHTALRYYGVPVELALYPREPHGFTERPHQVDLMERLAVWIDRYLLS